MAYKFKIKSVFLIFHNRKLMRTTKQKLFLALKIFAVVIAILIVLFYYYRESLLTKGITKVTTKFSRDYGATLVMKNAHFDGFTAIIVEDVSLVPKNGDTLLKIQKCRTSVSFWHLFVGKIQLGSLIAKNGFVRVIKNEKGSNFSEFIKKSNPKNAQAVEIQKRNYAETAYRIISTVLDLVPTNLNLENLTFYADDMGKKATVYCQKMILKNENLASDIQIKTDAFTQRLRLKGTTDPRDEECDIEFFNLDTGAIQIPYIKERFGISSSFKSVRWNVSDIDMDGDELILEGIASVKSLKVNHPRISLKDVVVNQAQFDYKFVLGSNSISIDSASQVQINKLKFKPYVAIETEKDTIYNLKVSIPKMKAQDFISSLPDGLFDNIKGMKTSGEFDFKFNFKLNKNKPQNVILGSKLNKFDLKILQYGTAKLDKMNADFEYRALIKDELQRPIFVGASNPNFTPLASISPLLKKCVLTTEDPSFMKHKGFVTEAFKMSIIKNLETKKFSRGASTISMQLVKNVFLTREKTLARKLEEILLVFILENNNVVPKDRMLEVYFNIIEWGPDVYGIGEASQFYFQKKPIDLTLNECLFLAHIIPSPRKFMNNFNGQGGLSGKAVAKNNYITNLMIKRGTINAGEALNRYQNVNVSGRARSFIKISKIVQDSIVQDSIVPILDEEFDEDLRF